MKNDDIWWSDIIWTNNQLTSYCRENVGMAVVGWAAQFSGSPVSQCQIGRRHVGERRVAECQVGERRVPEHRVGERQCVGQVGNLQPGCM